MASTLLWPSVSWVAMICRFRLVSAMSSSSNRSSAPTPLRAMASAAKPPTPPTPNTATRAAARRAMASGPNSISVRANWFMRPSFPAPAAARISSAGRR